jgi:hypothetical protein
LDELDLGDLVSVSVDVGLGSANSMIRERKAQQSTAFQPDSLRECTNAGSPSVARLHCLVGAVYTVRSLDGFGFDGSSKQLWKALLVDVGTSAESRKARRKWGRRGGDDLEPWRLSEVLG